MSLIGMAQGAGVEWVRTSPSEDAGKRRDDLEAELRALRDEVRRLKQQVDALATEAERPSIQDERVPTHVARFDEALEGGVPRGSIVTIMGPGGSMKTSLALHILTRNRTQGRRGVYVTVEENRDSILRTMRHLGLGTEEDFIVDIARLRTEHEGAEEVRDWLRVLKDFLERRRDQKQISLVMIDSLDVLASMAHVVNARNELFNFFQFLRSLGVTTFVVADQDPLRPGIAPDVAFLSDGVLELRFSGAGEGKVQLLLRCAKMRYTDHLRDYFVLTYRNGFAAKPYEAPRTSRWRRS